MDEDKTVRKEISGRKRILTAVILAAAGAALIAGSLMLYRTKKARQAEADKIYDRAISLAFTGSYDEAEELFASVVGRVSKEKREEIFDYLSFCQIRRDYEEGNVMSAYAWIDVLDLTGLTPEQEKILEDLRQELNDAQDAYWEERIRVGKDVPFVGMPEEFIGDTCLGAPSGEVQYENEYVDGELYSAKTYTFRQSGRTIFTARCVKGKVTKVNDMRDTGPSVPYRPKPDSFHDGDDDPYNVNDYYSAEDFYEDCRDEFDDYEEAEDYFYEYSE